MEEAKQKLIDRVIEIIGKRNCGFMEALAEAKKEQKEQQ